MKWVEMVWKGETKEWLIFAIKAVIDTKNKKRKQYKKYQIEYVMTVFYMKKKRIKMKSEAEKKKNEKIFTIIGIVWSMKMTSYWSPFLCTASTASCPFSAISDRMPLQRWDKKDLEHIYIKIADDEITMMPFFLNSCWNIVSYHIWRKFHLRKNIVEWVGRKEGRKEGRKGKSDKGKKKTKCDDGKKERRKKWITWNHSFCLLWSSPLFLRTMASILEFDCVSEEHIVKKMK